MIYPVHSHPLGVLLAFVFVMTLVYLSRYWHSGS